MKCNLCPLDAIIYLRDLKGKPKSTCYLCEKHFKQFCSNLISKKVEYETNPISSGDKKSRKQKAS